MENVEFLYFYEDYAWKFKKLTEYYQNFGSFYQTKYIKMSTLFSVDADTGRIIDKMIYERKEEVK